MSRRQPTQRGFTLLEVLIVLGLVGLVTSSMVVGARSMAKSELRGSASKVAGTMRYLFDRASTTGKVHRLVLDFSTGKYWAEESDDRYFMPRERETEETRALEAEEIAEEEEAKKVAEAAKNEKASAGEYGYDFSHYDPKEWKSRRAKFSAFKETVLKTRQISGGKLVGIYSPRVAEPVTQGHGYLYFFPMGQTESAIVYLSDAKQETFFSLVVHPLNGRVKVVGGYVKPPVDQTLDDEGTEIE